MSKVLLSLLIVGLVAASVSFLPVPKYGGYSVDYGHHGLYFSAAAYCSKESIEKWDCGAPCEYHPGFKPIKVYDYSLFNTPN